jgi:hypothetical protein
LSRAAEGTYPVVPLLLAAALLASGRAAPPRVQEDGQDHDVFLMQNGTAVDPIYYEFDSSVVQQISNDRLKRYTILIYFSTFGFKYGMEPHKVIFRLATTMN